MRTSAPLLAALSLAWACAFTPSAAAQEPPQPPGPPAASAEAADEGEKASGDSANAASSAEVVVEATETAAETVVEAVEDAAEAIEPEPEPETAETEAGLSIEGASGSAEGLVEPAGEIRWRWQAPATGELTLDTTGSSFDTVLFLLDAEGGEIEGNDDGADLSGGASLLKLPAIAGRDYFVRVSGYEGAGGRASVSWSLREMDLPPNLDKFGAAILEGASGRVETPHALGVLWWRWTAPEDGLLSLSTEGSNFDTVMCLLAADEAPGGALSKIECNDDAAGPGASGGSFSRAGGVVRSGDSYFVQVAGYENASGQAVLSWEFEALDLPVNMDAEGALPLGGLSGRLEADLPRELLWWSWTAPADGVLSVSTEGSGFDTVMALLRPPVDGAEPEQLIYSDDAPDSVNGSSAFEWLVRSGEEYLVAAGGYGDAGGQVVVSWDFGEVAVAANGSAESAVPLDSIASGDSAALGWVESEAWWSWTAPSDGIFSANTDGAAFDTVLDLYAAPADDDETPRRVASDDDGGQTPSASALSAPVRGGAEYLLRVSKFGGQGPGGRASLAWSFAEMEIAPNKDAASALALEGETGSLRTLIARDGEAWWRWTAPANGVLVVDTEASGFDTNLCVHRAQGVDTLACNDDAEGYGGNFSRIETSVRSGEAYLFQAGGFFDNAGVLVLNWSFGEVERPANDDAESAAEFTPGPEYNEGRFEVSTRSATSEPGEPAHDGASARHSVWWRWTVPMDGVLEIDTAGSDFDTVLAAYRSPRAGSFELIASDDDGGQDGTSFLKFDAREGETVFVAADGYDGATGDLALYWRLAYPSEAALSWAWTAPLDGVLEVDTRGTDFGTSLALRRAEASGGEPDQTAANDRAYGERTSRLEAPVQAGQAYFVDVYSNEGEPGDEILINFSFRATLPAEGAPSPEAPGTAPEPEISEAPGTGDTPAATTPDDPFVVEADAGELPFSLGAGESAWFSWTPGAPGFLDFAATGSENATLTLFLRPDYPGAEPVALAVRESLNARQGAQISAWSRLGREHLFEVQAGEGAEGGLAANWRFVAIDELSEREGSLDLRVDSSRSARFLWEAPADGSMEISANLLPDVAQEETRRACALLISDDPFAPLAFQGCANNAGDESSSMSFEVAEGQRFILMLEGENKVAGNLSWTFTERAVASASGNDSPGDAALAEGALGRSEAQLAEGSSALWWRWTAPAGGFLRVNTEGSGFDTVLTLYAEADGELLELASNDDGGGLSNGASALNKAVEAGESLFLRVSPYSEGQAGLAVLNWDCARADQPHNASPESAAPMESPEGRAETNLAFGGAWWRWSASETGVLRANTSGSAFDTTLGAYSLEARDGAGREQLAWNDDGGSFGNGASELVLPIRPGEDILLELRPYLDGQGGLAVLSWTFEAMELPGNARPGDAAVLEGPEGRLEEGLPFGELWWKWTAPAGGMFSADTVGSDFDTVLKVYEAAADFDPSNAQELAYNDDGEGIGHASKLNAFVRAGQEYFVALSALGNGGAAVLSWSFEEMDLPANVEASQAAPLEGASGELSSPMSPTGSLWWRWTAPANGLLSANTNGSDFDTTLAVYGFPAEEGAEPEQIAADDDGGLSNGASALALPVQEGVEYLLRAASYASPARGASQSLAFAWRFEEKELAANTSVAAAQTIEGASGSVQAESSGTSLWWSWTAPADGALSLDTAGSAFDTTLTLHGPASWAEGEWEQIAFNDDGPNVSSGSSALSSLVRSGTEYRIELGVYSGSAQGPAALSWSFEAMDLPVNLSAESASPAEGASGQAEANLAGVGPDGLWWTWTAPADGFLALTAEGGQVEVCLVAAPDEPFDFGGLADNLVWIGCDSSGAYSGEASAFAGPAKAGKRYFFRASSMGVSGAISLSWTFQEMEIPGNLSQETPALLEGASGEVAAAIPGSQAWWTWTAPADGLLSATARAENFSPFLQIDEWMTDEYGGSYPALAASDEASEWSENPLEAAATAPVKAGQNYLVSLMVPSGAAQVGRGSLSWSFREMAAASNGSESQAAALEGDSGQAEAVLLEGALWWTWTAPADGVLEASTSGSAFDTVLCLFERGAQGEARQIECNDDAPGAGDATSYASAKVSEGTAYLLKVENFGGSGGYAALGWSFLDARSMASNRSFGSAVRLEGASGEERVSLARGGEAWWKWTAPANGRLSLDAGASATNPSLTAFRGADLDELIASTANAATPEARSRASFPVRSGDSITLALAGAKQGLGGAASLAWSFEEAALETVIEGASGQAEAAVEPKGEAWWKWTAPADGQLSLSTEGSDFDTFLCLFAPPARAGSPMQEIGCHDDADFLSDTTSRLSAQVEAGQSCLVRATGAYDDESGRAVLSWSFEPAE